MPPGPSKRQRLRLTVGTLMLGILLFGLWLGRQVNKAREQRAAVAAVKSHGGWVHFDYELVGGKPVAGRAPWAPRWLRAALGDEYFQDIRWVSFVYDDSTGKRYDNEKTEACDDVLAILASQSGLQHLFLKGPQATDQGLAHLRQLRQLEDLYIWDSTLISDGGVEPLRDLVNLKNLHLDNSKLTDKGFRSLARLTKLEHLVLEHHAFGDEGMTTVGGMKHLTWLCVGGTSTTKSAITDEGLSVVAGLEQLENLELGYSRVTDRGLKYLAGLKKLKILELSGCNITDEGLRQLAGNTNLRWLLLANTRITGDGLEHLTGLTKLKLLTVPGSIPKAAKDRFRGKMPGGLIVH